MDGPIPLTEDIFWIGVQDRETDLFEGLWPVPGGVTYNSFLIVDRKTALIDTVREPYLTEYLDKIRRSLPKGKSPDYLIINHMEPDHSGCLRVIRRLFPEMTIVGNRWTLRFLDQYHGITEGTLCVQDGDVIDLGTNKLRLLLTPMVHWPETMMTYLPNRKVLFSGDVFGGFGAPGGSLFDDGVATGGQEDETRRYFSNVLGKYSPMVQKALARVRELDTEVIASAHGMIWRKNPGRIVGWYDGWSRQRTKKGVVVAYGSMYRNTKRMAEAAAGGLADEGIGRVVAYDLSRSHISYVLSDIWRFKGLLLGSATYNTKLFPAVGNLVSILKEKGLTNRRIGIFGSYGWSGGGVKELREFASGDGWKLVEPVLEVKGAPTAEDLSRCALLGRNLAGSL